MVRSRPASPSWAPCLPASTPPTHRKAPSRAEHRYRGFQSCLRSSSLPPQRDSPGGQRRQLEFDRTILPTVPVTQKRPARSSEDTIPQSPRPTPERPRHLPDPTSHPDRPSRPLYPPPVPTGFEEGDHFPVHIGEPLDKDEVARLIEDAQPGVWDGPGEGPRVGDGHVAVLGAVDHERGRGYVPDLSGEVEVRPGPGLLVVGGAGRRVSETPAYDLLELIPVLGAIRRRSRRLEAPSDAPLRRKRTPSKHVRKGLYRHLIGPAATVAGADQDQTVDKVGPEQRQLLPHKAAERSSEDVGLLYAQVVQ